MTGIRIAIVDDHPIFREGVASCLSEIGGFDLVGEGNCRVDAELLAERAKPDVMLLDISMPGGGPDAVASIMERRPSQKIVMLTVSESNGDVAAALKSGAKGYVLKGVGSRTLADVLKLVHAGEMYLSPVLSARMVSNMLHRQEDDPRPRLDTLSGREQEVLRLVANGLSNKCIGRELDLHEKTVKHHMTRIFSKLKVKNRTEAAMALRDAATQA
ncbi:MULTISPECIES: response regulator transcription factor [unclassified Rhizobium]|uniref:LuxR C-terminal-related transcriptional regulator n=1 Tax=unclassified Rhizobium TaxID=2613769 RepID=UPI0006FA82E5|nr:MULTISPECIES: response regulator transcription factor [unclassified Rhizobium]KQV40019.1 two-component system response regulator [Rhizobium sp. Root1212]KRD31729.1 two-component system response regulator [Rhizobium sp. Root268]